MIFNINNRTNYVYYCDGLNDNIKISNIVKKFLEGGSGYDSMNLSIMGSLGIQTPAKGTGSVSDPYCWFDIGVVSNRKVVLDFTSCTQIAPPIISGAYNTIFYSADAIHVVGAHVVANNTATNTVIRLVNNAAGVLIFDICRIWINGHKDSYISQRGNFINCRGSVANLNSTTYCFLTSGYSTVRVYGGEYYAYTNSTGLSAIVGQSDSTAVSILYGVSAPTVARSGYRQTNALIQYDKGGYINCTDLITTLPLTVVTGISNIRGTIPFSKTDSM